MKKKIKELIVNNMINLIGFILPYIGVIITTITIFIKQRAFSLYEIVITILFIILFTAIIIQEIWKRVSYKSYYYPWHEVRDAYNYYLLDKTYTYTRSDDDKLQYERCITVKSLSNRLDSIEDRYKWTGNVNKEVEIHPIEGISSITNIANIGVWNYFSIRFNNHLSKGEKHTVRYGWIGIENCTSSSPFVSASTDELTKNVTFNLTLGHDYENQEIICEEFRAIESLYPIRSFRDKLDANGNYKWEVKGVKRYRMYRIRWSWEKGQPATEIFMPSNDDLIS